MNREYIVVEEINKGNTIYYKVSRIDKNGISHRLIPSIEQILYNKILKKYSFFCVGNKRYYKDVSNIMRDYTKIKTKNNGKKVDRNKSKSIVPTIILISSLIAGGLLLNKAYNKDKTKDIGTTTIATSNSYGTPVDLTEPTLGAEIEVKAENVTKTNFYYYFDGDRDLEAYERVESKKDEEENEEEVNLEEIIEKVDNLDEKNEETENLEENTEEEEETNEDEEIRGYFDKFAVKYGISDTLLRAMAAQESSGIHHKQSLNGYAIGIMQIEMSVWDGAEIRVFNFEKNEYEIIVIDGKKLVKSEYNIEIGAAIFQNYLYATIRNNPNMSLREILAFTIQKYNMGPGNMARILEYGDKWINYRENANGGDPIYVEHVLRRLDDGTELMVKLPDGSTISTTILNVANIEEFIEEFIEENIEDYSLSVRKPR